jgi:hypothetical protein
MSKKHKNPNKAWQGEGEWSAKQFESEDSETAAATLETLAVSKRFLRTEWPKRRDAFIV